MSRSASAADAALSAAEARALFARYRKCPALVLAVSGGPDSMALMWLAARWRAGLKRGPKLVAVTVDHGLRAEAACEARLVKRQATALGISHRTVKWTGPKPASGIQAAARAARYRLLARVARASGASHVLTAHTSDDQAETVLMRMARGSGLAGLAAMAADSPREGLMLGRPLIEVSKARLMATLEKAGIACAQDSSNRDPRYARVRWRALMPQLAAEGLDARTLTRLASRLSRADAALEAATDAAFDSLVQRLPPSRWRIARDGFARLPQEVRLRLVGRAVDRLGHEGPVELAKLERLMAALDAAPGVGRLKRTLAGAVVSLGADHLTVEPAPARRKIP
ncbi:MAG: tRNA lysidine(34) synthetase TilS [Xanthobacteraceae bacterium]|nr:MAG: tRNA lysidine(34) synthetase TilS [Xanthobacteraceae bacterium]